MSLSQEHFTLSPVSDESEERCALRQQLIAKLVEEWLALEGEMSGGDEVIASAAWEQTFQNALASGAEREGATVAADRAYDRALDRAYAARLSGFGDKIRKQIAIEEVIAMLGGNFTPP